MTEKPWTCWMEERGVNEDVAKAIEDVVEKAGTQDADWNVLKAAGEIIAALRAEPLHDNVDDCPTYYDGCQCTRDSVRSLLNQLKNAAEHQRDVLLNVLHNIGAKLECETQFFNCGACEATEKAVDECVAIINTCLIGTKWERKDG